MSNLTIVNDDDAFNALLKGAGDDMVVVDFYTSWCKPCKIMEPVFEAMAIHYPKVHFLKVDADKCFDTAMSHKVSGVPCFVIYFQKAVIETVQGANPKELELKVRCAEAEFRKSINSLQRSRSFLPNNVKPVVSTFGKLGSVAQYIDQENSHCLNDLSPTSFHTFIQGKRLVSGKGTGKILLVYSFTQKMMLQSFKIRANPQTGPKVLRIFVNHPKVLDFAVGATLAPSQEVTLSHHDLSGERAIELRSGSFQVVTNVQIFVTSGQTKNSRIEIEALQLFGAPVLAIQSLLDSHIPFTTDMTPRPANSVNANEPQGPGQDASNPDNNSEDNENNDENSTETLPTPSNLNCEDGMCYLTKQPRSSQQGPPPELERPPIHRRNSHSHASYYNYTAEQVPGHSRYLLADSKKDANDNADRRQQQQQQPASDKSRHHHHHPYHH